MEFLLRGESLLLRAPTAGGKTEAYAAPIAERLASLPEGERRAVLAVVVVPTRALANDLERRLESPMERMGLSFGVWTSDRKRRRGGDAPQVVVTTPEGLDAMLSRRRALLQSLRAVVVDELHLLDGTPRGDQLAILLHRLRDIAKGPMQTVGVSATLDAPEELSRRYLGGTCAVVDVPQEREYKLTFFRTDLDPSVAHRLDRPLLAAMVGDVLWELARARVRKVLVFVRSRKEVQHLVATLPGSTPYGDRIYGHHGSLAREERERIEALLQRQRSAVVVSTSTLELGIDVGSLDYVLLARPPLDPAQLLQRVGRAGRRGGPVRFGVVVANEWEAALFQLLWGCALSGELLQHRPPPRFSVILQQALSLTGGRYPITAERLAKALPPWMRPPLARLEDMLQHAATPERGLFDALPDGGYRLGEKGSHRWAWGSVHSAFEAKGWRGKRRFVGPMLRVEHRPGNELTRTPRSRPPPFISFRFARVVAEALGLERDEMRLVRTDTQWLLVHGLGSVGSLLLHWLLQRRGEVHALFDPHWPPGLLVGLVPFELDEEPVVFNPKTPPIDTMPSPPCREEVEAFVRSKERYLAFRLDVGAFFRDLPDDQRLEELLGLTGLDEVCAWWRGARLRVRDGPAPSWWKDFGWLA